MSPCSIGDQLRRCAASNPASAPVQLAPVSCRLSELLYLSDLYVLWGEGVRSINCLYSADFELLAKCRLLKKEKYVGHKLMINVLNNK